MAKNSRGRSCPQPFICMYIMYVHKIMYVDNFLCMYIMYVHKIMYVDNINNLLVTSIFVVSNFKLFG